MKNLKNLNIDLFTNRVEYYIKYRPLYPEAMVSDLHKKGLLKAEDIIADIGCGTGFSSVRFLEFGNIVYGVEPNLKMRNASMELLGHFKNFKSIDGKAEKTTLKSNSIDLIFCGQSYHWFDVSKTKKEFQRIIKTNGVIVLAWNERSPSDTFQQQFEAVLETLPKYREVTHKNTNINNIKDFLSPLELQILQFDNFQVFDLDGLKGRLLSSSYCPEVGDKHYDRVMKAVEKLFFDFEVNNKIVFKYNTILYIGH